MARYCGVSLRTLDQWMASNKIPFIKIGRAVLFRPVEVERALGGYERKAITI